jgi:hypothetical protein
MMYPFLQKSKEIVGCDVTATLITDKIQILESWLDTYKNENTKQMLYLIAYDIE